MSAFDDLNMFCDEPFDENEIQIRDFVLPVIFPELKLDEIDASEVEEGMDEFQVEDRYVDIFGDFSENIKKEKETEKVFPSSKTNNFNSLFCGHINHLLLNESIDLVQNENSGEYKFVIKNFADLYQTPITVERRLNILYTFPEEEFNQKYNLRELEEEIQIMFDKTIYSSIMKRIIVLTRMKGLLDLKILHYSNTVNNISKHLSYINREIRVLNFDNNLKQRNYFNQRMVYSRALIENLNCVNSLKARKDEISYLLTDYINSISSSKDGVVLLGSYKDNKINQ